MKIGLLSSNVQKRREMILNGNILNTLLFLSLPTILMGMVSSLIPLSDGLFLNHTSGYLVAAAVGFGQPIINILNALSLGLGVHKINNYLHQLQLQLKLYKYLPYHLQKSLNY